MELPVVSVVYLLRERADGVREVLLGHKRTLDGTLGRVVGVGGKVEPGESAAEAAVREVREETGLVVDAQQLTPVGVLEYLFPAGPRLSQRCHVFLGVSWQGTEHPTDEIVPEWFAEDAIPFDRMWDDTVRWLPDVLAGATVHATYTFGSDLATVVDEDRAA